MVAPEIAAAIIGAGSSLFNSGANAFTSALSSNKSYKRAVQLWQMQANWQERMANTAHQREVSDLRAAGLNPILSATGGSGASVGSVGMPTAQTFQPDIDESGLSSALAYRQQKNLNKQVEADVEKIKGETELNSAIKKKTDADAINSMTLNQAQVDLYKKELELKQKEIDNYDYALQTNRINANASMTGALASQTQASTSARDLELKKSSDAYGSPIGRAYNSGKAIVKDVLGIPKNVSFENHLKNVIKYKSLNLHYKKNGKSIK